jgi:hypothetical protein
MSSLTILGDSSGSVLLQAPSVAGSTNIAIAAQSGTLNVGGPCFSAILSSNQNVSASTWTKAQINSKQFDTNNNYDNSTNYRFTPTIAGYYQVNYGICFNSTSVNPTLLITGLYKNGTRYAGGSISYTPNTTVLCAYSQVIYMNGSTDYLEVYGYCSGGTGTLFFQGNGSALNDTCYFQASLIRTA